MGDDSANLNSDNLDKIGIEFGRLPLRAIIAVTTRMVLRVESLYEPRKDLPDVERTDRKQSIQMTIQMGQSFAEAEVELAPDITAVEAQVIQAEEDAFMGQYVATAAVDLLRSVHEAIRSLTPVNRPDFIRLACSAQRFAMNVFGSTIKSSLAKTSHSPQESTFKNNEKTVRDQTMLLIQAVHSDLKRATESTTALFPQRGPRIDVTEQGPLGPLWPNGLP